MSFFRQFPLTAYDLQKTGALNRIVDLFRNVTSPQIKLDPTIAYTNYRIQNGDRPDVVSQKLYGDPDYYWTFFIINDKLKSGHSTWPMSHVQLDKYLTREYDTYSVVQMGDTNTHCLPNGFNEVISTDLNSITADQIDLNADLAFESLPVATTFVDNTRSIDFFKTPYYVYDMWNSQIRSVMKYDPYMQQLWIVNSGSSDTFLTGLQNNGIFRLTASATDPSSALATITINGAVYSAFSPMSSTAGQSIAAPGILPYIPLGRNAIHHYVYTPQLGDVVKFQGMKGAVTSLIPAYANSYGGVVVDNGQPFYFTDPQGFLITARDAINTINNSNSPDAISRADRIYPISYADYEEQLNEQRSSIRVVNPTYIRAFVKQYRDLINA